MTDAYNARSFRRVKSRATPPPIDQPMVLKAQSIPSPHAGMGRRQAGQAGHLRLQPGRIQAEMQTGRATLIRPNQQRVP